MSRFQVLSDAQWSLIEEMLPRPTGRPGRRFSDARTMVEGIVYRYRTGIAWRDLPEVFGSWQTVWTWHHWMASDGTWDRVLAKLTAGAAFAHIDLALSLVRSISPDLAQHVAKLLIIDERPSQAAFVAYEHLRHEDPIVVEFERFVRARLDEPFNVAFVAQSLGTSRRTLERRVRAALNLTPLGFVQRLRIERARHLSATTDLTSAEIAPRVGYANAETLRSLLRRERRRS